MNTQENAVEVTDWTDAIDPTISQFRRMVWKTQRFLMKPGMGYYVLAAILTVPLVRLVAF